MEYLTLKAQRERDMRRLYNRILNEGKINMRILDMKDRADIVRNSPAPRLYISAKVAQKLVRAYLDAGGPTCCGFEAVRRQIYVVEEYQKLMATKTIRNKSAINLCTIIVNSPAPLFFCSRQRALHAIFWYKTIATRENRKKQKKKQKRNNNE